MSHHLLWRLCGCVFIWISANVNLVDSWCFWGAALWPVLGGCCFVWTAAGGSRLWLFAACELEPFQFINRLPGVLNDLVQVAAFTFSRIRKLLELNHTASMASRKQKQKQFALACAGFATTSQVKHLHCYEAVSIQPSQLLQQYKHRFIQEIFLNHCSQSRYFIGFKRK